MNPYFFIGTVICLLSIGWSQNWVKIPFSNWAGVGIAIGIAILAYGFRKKKS
jgi:hypothetical protein